MMKRSFRTKSRLLEIVSTNPIPPQYRHLFYLSLAVNYNLGQLNPEGYHLFNLALHFFTAVTVLLIAFFTLESGTSVGSKAAVSISGIVAFLFALNPVHSETVTYISARASGMAAWFYLLSLLFFISGKLESFQTPFTLSGWLPAFTDRFFIRRVE